MTALVGAARLRKDGPEYGIEAGWAEGTPAPAASKALGARRATLAPCAGTVVLNHWGRSRDGCDCSGGAHRLDVSHYHLADGGCDPGLLQGSSVEVPLKQQA